MRHAFAAVLLLAAAACTPGGEYSGVPDSTVGDWRWPSGTTSTSGRIDLYREGGWTAPPAGRTDAPPPPSPSRWWR